MAHRISAIVFKPSCDIHRLAEFDLPLIRAGEFVIVPLNADHCDTWTERLDLAYGPNRSEMILDCPFAHHIANIGAEDLYAIIETDYFGGNGDQVSAVYRVGMEKPIYVSKRVRKGAINAALRTIGVIALPGQDEFDTLGLSQCRDFDDLFDPCP